MLSNRNKHCGKNPLLAGLWGIPVVLLLCGTVYADPPLGDNCEDAIELDSKAPFPPDFASIDATDATLDPADPLLSCNTPGDDDGSQTVWFKHTPETSGWINYSTIGSLEADGESELDTAHGAFVGGCGSLTEVACVDVSLTDDLNVEVEAGQTYYIKVGQYLGANNAGTVDMSVNEGEPPLVPQKLVLESTYNGTTPPLTQFVGEVIAERRAAPPSRIDAFYQVPNRTMPGAEKSVAASGVVGSEIPGAGRTRWRGPAELKQVFDGGDNDDNFDLLGFILSPPDTVGDVGKDHYVQMVNLVTEIFDKEGNTVLGPFPTSAFFASLQDSFCSTEDDGDPIVLYDEETDRWMVAQFLAGFQFGLCIAMSTSGDPTGSWHAYEFDFTGIGFPDYPKFGFATGALNVMVNLFDPLQGSALGAIDKSEMLAGDPATMVLFTGGENLELYFGWVPGDNDGPVFDNTLPTFFTGPPFFSNALIVGTLTPDWETPENTGLSITGFLVSPYDSGIGGIEQPGSGTSEGGNPDWPSEDADDQIIAFLDPLSFRLMHRGQTRDFGKVKTAVISHSVNVDGSGRAGVRWYELRNHKDRGWFLKKEETFSPDGNNRWMPSIAMTRSGETCLGYSISSSTVHPSIGITGRKGTSNHMNIREFVAYDGNVDGYVQRGTERWGDYSSMNIDPVDDTCWYTTEHATSLESISPSRGLPYEEVAGWATKVIQYDVN